MEITPLVQRLERKIMYAAMKYYGSGEVSMSDQAFDMMVGQLKEADPDHWLLHIPGWGYIPEKGKVRHIGKGKIGSLDKVKFPEIKPSMNNAVWTPKFDGISLVLYHHQGQIKGVTRGNGEIGMDVTDKLKAILENRYPTVLENLKNKPGLWSCRGEVIIDLAFEKKLKEQGVISLRNYGAGIMNRNEINEEISYLRFIPYVIRIDLEEENFDDQELMLWHLKELGFDPCPHASASGDATPEWIESIYNQWSQQYPIDGLCFSEDDEWTQEGHDISDFAEETTTAYKMPTETKEGVVDRIESKTGPGGRCAPTVVLVEPVELLGAMIQRISAHHAQYVRDNNLGEGAIVEITRANEVIPYITSVIDGAVSPDLPTHCNACKTEVEWSGCYLVCPNFDCPAKSHTTLYRLLGIASIPDGLSEMTITKWLAEFPMIGSSSKIDNIFDFLVHFASSGAKNIAPRHEFLMEIFKKHFGTLLWKLEVNVEKKLSEGFSFEEFWYMLNLSQLGPKNSEKLASADPRDLALIFNHKLPKDSPEEAITQHLKRCEEVIEPYGLPKPARASIFREADYWIKLSNRLVLIQKDAPKGIFSGKNIVFTGIRLKGEDKKLFLQAGGKESSSVSRKTDFVVTDNPAGQTTKLKKARSLQKPIVTVEQLMEMLG